MRMFIQRKNRYQWIALFICFFIITGCGKSESNNDRINDENPEVMIEKVSDDFDSYEGYEIKRSYNYTTPLLNHEDGKITGMNNINEETIVQGIHKENQSYQWTKGEGTTKERSTNSDEYSSENNYLIDRVYKYTKNSYAYLSIQNDGNAFKLSSYQNAENNNANNATGNDYKNYITFYNDYKDYFDIKKEQIDGKTNITLFCKDLKGYQEAFFGKVNHIFEDAVAYPNAAYQKVEYVYTIDENNQLIKFECHEEFEFEKDLIAKTDIIDTIQKKNVTFDVNKIDLIMDEAKNGVIKEGDEIDWIM